MYVYVYVYMYVYMHVLALRPLRNPYQLGSQLESNSFHRALVSLKALDEANNGVRTRVSKNTANAKHSTWARVQRVEVVLFNFVPF